MFIERQEITKMMKNENLAVSQVIESPKARLASPRRELMPVQKETKELRKIDKIVFN